MVIVGSVRQDVDDLRFFFAKELLPYVMLASMALKSAIGRAP
jgi:hypothetical protein